MLSDNEIARQARLQPITAIAEQLNIPVEKIVPYGWDKAKIPAFSHKGKGKIVLVTAISPTPAGEGKSTTTIGLGDALNRLGKKAIICLREPSLGPVFGLKGGACGGGYHQVVPMEAINLHFTGDMHAITTANNLICAVLDNTLHHGNPLNIDPQTISIKRVMDMNDRTLREITIAQGSAANGVERKAHFEITVASELMAILCLAKDEDDFRHMLESMTLAQTYEGKRIRLSDLNITGAIMALMKEALMPNLVQTLENNPVLIHGGPFANIAHGCNSLLATQTASHLGDIVVTEAGFGSDLGFEKFIDIKARKGGLSVDCAVLVATIRALKMHGGVSKEALSLEDCAALERGFANLLQHTNNIRTTGVPFVVAINRFASDTQKEIETLTALCQAHDIKAVLCDGFTRGSEGTLSLAQAVLEQLDQSHDVHFYYDLEDSIEEKLNKIIQKSYGGAGFSLSDEAKKQLAQFPKEALHYPICMAKTPASFSDDPSQIGAPKDFSITITDFKLNTGAQFIIAYANKIMTLPGLNAQPNAQKIRYHQGVIDGLS